MRSDAELQKLIYAWLDLDPEERRIVYRAIAENVPHGPIAMDLLQAVRDGELVPPFTRPKEPVEADERVIAPSFAKVEEQRAHDYVISELRKEGALCDWKCYWSIDEGNQRLTALWARR